MLADAEQAARSPRLPEADETEIPFVTLDPLGSRDLDQAFHFERRGDGYRVRYAIADVAAFVDPGGPMDVEAHERGETLYAPDENARLYPPVLSEGAASLLPDETRPAVVWTMDVDETGEGVDVTVGRALVRSRAQLDYVTAQQDLDGGTADEQLRLLREVGILRGQREVRRGGVSLAIPEQVITQRDGGFGLQFRAPLPVEQWNAQISLMTGMAAAELMLEGDVGLLRTVPVADPERLERLRLTAKALRVEWPEGVSYPDFIRSLSPFVARQAALLIESASLLRGSGYLAFAGDAPEDPVHSALASTYAHTTAPLRRLVDRYVGEACVALSAGRGDPGVGARRVPDAARGDGAVGRARGPVRGGDRVDHRGGAPRAARGRHVRGDRRRPERAPRRRRRRDPGARRHRAVHRGRPAPRRADRRAAPGRRRDAAPRAVRARLTTVRTRLRACSARSERGSARSSPAGAA